MSDYPRIAKLNTLDRFRQHLAQISAEIPVAESVDPQGALAQPMESRSAGRIGNRFCILPMEGWDGTPSGHPSDLTRRRWKNFGASGAKLIWGGEAAAVCNEGRANPNQLLATPDHELALSELQQVLVDAHQEAYGTTDDLLVGLQLTHSGRFARPHRKDQLEPRTIYRHPILDDRFHVPAEAVLSDDQLERMIDQFVIAAQVAEEAGFQFVDLKHCHGYLGHELLSAVHRPGKFGGSLENRTRFLRELVAGVRTTTELAIGVRVSIFDLRPFEAGPEGIGQPTGQGNYPYAFGGDQQGAAIDLGETRQLLEILRELEIELVCTTAGSPYYNPHIQRPATFPPSDGYLPPEDPLLGVARQIQATAELKRDFPELIFVGSGYSYLQDWLPHVGQAVIDSGAADIIGLGRMVLSYPELPRDVLTGQPLARKKICRTFSDCTTAPRNGMVSGCYPLDPFYKDRPEAKELIQLKKGLRS